MAELTENQMACLKLVKEDYQRKLMTWALDRALEVMKVQGYSAAVSAENLTKDAETLCAWLEQRAKTFPVPSNEEAEAHLSKFREIGEIV